MFFLSFSSPRKHLSNFIYWSLNFGQYKRLYSQMIIFSFFTYHFLLLHSPSPSDTRDIRISIHNGLQAKQNTKMLTYINLRTFAGIHAVVKQLFMAQSGKHTKTWHSSDLTLYIHLTSCRTPLFWATCTNKDHEILVTNIIYPSYWQTTPGHGWKWFCGDVT